MKNVEFPISEFAVNCLKLMLLNFVIVKISILAKVCLCLFSLSVEDYSCN